MEMRPLGRSGMQVSRLALGTMTWGRDTDEHEARDQLLAFVEAGGTLVDTADVYADGRSEQIVGSLVDELGRDSVVLATKAVSRPGTDRRRDASRGHLLGALDASLRRLGVDHVDLWQLHAWDPLTPVEETLGALDTAVGKYNQFVGSLESQVMVQARRFEELAVDHEGREIPEIGPVEQAPRNLSRPELLESAKEPAE